MILYSYRVNALENRAALKGAGTASPVRPGILACAHVDRGGKVIPPLFQVLGLTENSSPPTIKLVFAPPVASGNQLPTPGNPHQLPGFFYFGKVVYNLIEMSRKILVLLILLGILIIITAGFFIWRNLRVKGNTNVTTETPALKAFAPKVEKFEVPILMYHYIRNAEGESELGKNLSVSPENFAAQMKFLKDDNYFSVKLADLADPDRAAISRAYYDKKKPIVITFDDGYDDAYTQAFPVLKNNGFIGTFFVIRNYTGREGRLNDAQISEMQKAGMEFGSHTLSHPDLTKISLDDARSQIFDSKGDWLTFCYPSGRFNDQIVSLVQEAGYLAAVTTKIGIARETTNLLEIPRVRIEDTSIQAFIDKISYAYEQTP